MNKRELAEQLLTDTLEALKQITASVGELNRKLECLERRIESGELRGEAEAEMRQWLAANPEAVTGFHEWINQLDSDSLSKGPTTNRRMLCDYDMVAGLRVPDLSESDMRRVGNLVSGMQDIAN